MNKKENRTITPSTGGGVFNDLANRIKLIMRLIIDRRISTWLKLLPIASLLYLIVPDIAPGPIDDAFVIWLGTYLFVELCPSNVVQEHQEAILGLEGKKPDDKIKEEDIIDAEYWEE